MSPLPTPAVNKTQLQVHKAALFHVQTNTLIELPTQLPVLHIGKPNNLVPPDIDVSGFPDSDIVSRVHGDIRIEGDAFYLEDTGSSNGTYVNNLPLPVGNRHKLRSGDRISLGKGDKVSFIFQLL
jgi:pSer/pThr/pTyr-binding forkhead associated (FHA) protein